MSRTTGCLAGVALMFLAGSAAAADFQLTRTSKGLPDLTGHYDGGTLTPLNRPSEYGDKQFLTREEADARPETAMIRLSAGVMSYMQGAALINKYYALGFSRDKDGTPVLTRRRALSSQLDLAKRAALTAAGEAKRRVGFIPAVARLTFEQAAALREGDDEDKLDALSAYWQSAFWSRLVIILPRS